MTLNIPSFSLNEPTSAIASKIEAAEHGLLHVRDLEEAPLETMQLMFDELRTNDELGDRLNRAYTNNLVYKDSYAQGKGGPNVDCKRVLDLSPERLEAIETSDPELLQLDDSGLNKALSFWDTIRQLSSKTTQALAEAIGTEDILEDTAFNYRMVDYYATSSQQDRVAPRCGEHRDFGWYTLIFAKEPGLQIQVDDGSWIDVQSPAIDGGGALLLFGWCTQIRSNGRIRAALHRVAIADDEVSKRRTTAVFFVAPKHCETALGPVVRPGTDPQYISNVKVGQLRGKMARKWQKREGTLSENNRILEEEEIRVTKMETQDDVVRNTIAV